MESISHTGHGALSLGRSSTFVVEYESSKSKLSDIGFRICNHAGIKHHNLLKVNAIPGFLQCYMNVRKIRLDASGGDSVEVRNRRFVQVVVAGEHGRSDADAASCTEHIFLGSSLSATPGPFHHVSRNRQSTSRFPLLGDPGFRHEKQLTVRFSYSADRNGSEVVYEGTLELGNGRCLHDKPQKELSKINIRVGRTLLLLFGGAVLFLLSGTGFRNLALAQQSNIATPTSPSDISQAQTTTTEDISVDTDKRDIPQQSIKDETSSSDSVPAERGPAVDMKSESKDKQAFLEEFVERYPTDITAQKALLRVYMTKGEVRSAVTVLNKLLGLEPDNLKWKYLRAQAYDFSGNTKAAREAFQELYELQPLSARILQGLAISMQKTGENPKAIIKMLKDAVKKAVMENKTKEARNLRMLLGQILTLQGNLLDALKQYKQMEDEDLSDFRPYLCQGLVYSFLGETEEAENYFRRYRELCPPDFPNRGYLDDLMLEAKSAANKLQELEQGSRLRSSGSNKRMKQPNIYGDQPTSDI